MNRLTCFVLTLCLLFSIGVYAEDTTYQSRSGAVQKIMQRIYDEGGSEPFLFDQLYCLHANGYVHFVPTDITAGYPVLCWINSSVESNGFTDVAGEHENAIAVTLSKKMDIVNGNGDGTFCPDEAITYNEAIKMLICSLGYRGRVIQDEAGYPDGYLSLADELGITTDMHFTGEEKLSVQSFDTLLNKSFGLDGYPARNVMTYLALPKTAEDCVNLYAKAIQERRGAIQYALFTTEKQQELYEDFKNAMWTTGVSSPWVIGYNAQKADDLHYSIVFHYATSTGSEPDQAVKLTLQQINGIYKIATAELNP